MDGPNWFEEWKQRRLRGIAAMEKIVAVLGRDMAFSHINDVQTGLATSNLLPVSLECLEAIANGLTAGESGKADDCMKLLDNGWTIQIYRNGLGSYTAAGLPPAAVKALEQAPFSTDDEDDDGEMPDPNERWITDDFTPAKALYRLTEKAILGRIV